MPQPSGRCAAELEYSLQQFEQPRNPLLLGKQPPAETFPPGERQTKIDIPLLDGRTFTAEDRAGTPLVVVINESMARHCWPGQRAIGKRMHVGNPKKESPWATVVGIVADTKGGGRDEPSTDQWYSTQQQPTILFGTDYKEALTSSAGGEPSALAISRMRWAKATSSSGW